MISKIRLSKSRFFPFCLRRGYSYWYFFGDSICRIPYILLINDSLLCFFFFSSFLYSVSKADVSRTYSSALLSWCRYGPRQTSPLLGYIYMDRLHTQYFDALWLSHAIVHSLYETNISRVLCTDCIYIRDSLTEISFGVYDALCIHFMVTQHFYTHTIHTHGEHWSRSYEGHFLQSKL